MTLVVENNNFAKCGLGLDITFLSGDIQLVPKVEEIEVWIKIVEELKQEI